MNSVGNDFVDGKLFRRLTDELVLLGEIFRREHFFRPALFEQKTAAGNFGLGNRSGSHDYPFQ